MTSTEKETTDLKNKMDAMLIKKKKNKVENNFTNMETFQTLYKMKDENDDTENDRQEITEEGKPLHELKLEIDEIKGIANTIVKDEIESNRKRAERWKSAFAFLTDLKPNDMGIKFEGITPVARGWGKIFKAIFYVYPIVVELVVDDCVSATPIAMEGGINSASFNQNKKHDGDIMKRTAHEFGYIVIALYFSHMMYSRLYVDEYKLQEIKNSLKIGISAFDFLTGRTVFLYCTLVPVLMYHFYYDVLRNLISFMGLDSYPSLKFIFIFIVCYGIAYLFLDKLAKMFLQSFEGQVSSFTYVVITIAWVIHLLSMPLDAVTGSMTDGISLPAIPSGLPSGLPSLPAGIMTGGEGNLDMMNEMLKKLPSEFEIMIQTSGLYIFVLLIHLVVSLLLFAPVCQLIVVIYFVYTLVGSPSNIIKVLLSFVLGEPKNNQADNDKTFIKLVSELCAGSLGSDTEQVMGGFDNVSYLYAYRYLFMFVMLMFFSFKTIQSGIEMKLLALRTAVTTINAYSFAFVAVCYFGRIYYEKYISLPSTFPVSKVVPKQVSSNGDGGLLSSMLGKAVSGATAVSGAATSGLSGVTAGLSGVTGLSGAAAAEVAGEKNIGIGNMLSSDTGIGANAALKIGLGAITGDSSGNTSSLIKQGQQMISDSGAAGTAVTGLFSQGLGKLAGETIFKKILTPEKIGGILDIFFEKSAKLNELQPKLKELLGKLQTGNHFEEVIKQLTTNQAVKDALISGKVVDFLFAIIDVLLNVEVDDRTATEIQRYLKDFIKTHKDEIKKSIPDNMTIIDILQSVASMVNKHSDIIKFAETVFNSAGDVNKIVEAFKNTKTLIPLLSAILEQVQIGLKIKSETEEPKELSKNILHATSIIIQNLSKIQNTLRNFVINDDQLKQLFESIKAGKKSEFLKAVISILKTYLSDDQTGLKDAKDAKAAIDLVSGELEKLMGNPLFTEVIDQIKITSIIQSIVQEL